MIKENIEDVKMHIDNAVNKGKRNVDDVTLIAVSKTKPVIMLKEAYDAGMRDFGENKVQEIKDKTEEIKEPLNWHMIGHLQANKVKYLPGVSCMIHSVDNRKLADEIEKQAAKHDLVMDVLIEVNMAG